MFDERFLRMWDMYLNAVLLPSITESLISIRSF